MKRLIYIIEKLNDFNVKLVITIIERILRKERVQIGERIIDLSSKQNKCKLSECNEKSDYVKLAHEISLLKEYCSEQEVVSILVECLSLKTEQLQNIANNSNVEAGPVEYVYGDKINWKEEPRDIPKTRNVEYKKSGNPFTFFPGQTVPKVKTLRPTLLSFVGGEDKESALAPHRRFASRRRLRSPLLRPYIFSKKNEALLRLGQKLKIYSVNDLERIFGALKDKESMENAKSRLAEKVFQSVKYTPKLLDWLVGYECYITPLPNLTLQQMSMRLRGYFSQETAQIQLRCASGIAYTAASGAILGFGRILEGSKNFNWRSQRRQLQQITETYSLDFSAGQVTQVVTGILLDYVNRKFRGYLRTENVIEINNDSKHRVSVGVRGDKIVLLINTERGGLFDLGLDGEAAHESIGLAPIVRE